jgi:hypothetical protein
VAATNRKTEKRMFEVLISHDGLDKGDRFTQDADDLGWAAPRVAAGYLRDVTEEASDAGEVGQG